MNILHTIKQAVTDRLPRFSGAEVDRLVKFAKSKQGLKLTAQLLRQTDSLTKKDIGTWRQAWQAAISVDTPNRGVLYDIYTDCLIDLHLSGCIGQRRGLTMQKAFRLVGKDGKENQEATELLRSEWFDDFCEYALDSRYWGHSLIQLGDIVTTESGMRFDNVELVPRKHVVPEYGVITPDPAADWRTGVSYREGELSQWCVEVGKPNDLGLLLKCAPSAISKKNMLAFWDMFGEIFGVPMRIAHTNATDENERRKIEASLDKMGAAFWALFQDGTDIEIKSNERSDAYNVYDKRVDRCNSEISKGILMQTMTIDNGSSLSQSETHLEILDNVVKADAKMLANVINDKLLPLMAAHKFPVKGLAFKWDESKSFTPEQIREEERMLLERFEIPASYFTENYNIPITGVRKQADPDSFFA